MKTSLVIALLAGIMSVQPVFAQKSKKSAPAVKATPAAKSADAGTAAPATSTATPSDEKVDISDLEKKYWAPKDTDFSVVQNRTYTKEKGYFLTAHGGPLVNDQFSEGYIYGGSLNYFFNERHGLQLTYLNSSLDRSKALKDLGQQMGSGVQPHHGRFKEYYGIGYNFVPFYAKMSFIGSRILYFDMAITPTIGMTKYEQILENVASPTKDALTYGIDVSQFFFLSENFAIRADIKNQWFKEEVVYFRNQGSAAKGDKLEDTTTQNTMFLLGLTLYFK